MDSIESLSSSSSRIKNVTIVKPIVYGNTAKYFPKKREEDNHTHEWTFYLKPFYNEDPSNYIQRVHIKLHDSYTNSNRILTKAPYEVSETGWGEFEIVCKVYFIDPNEKPITIIHLLKLFSTDTDVIQSRKHLVNEFYDEIVFHEPSQNLYNLLSHKKRLTHSQYNHDTDFNKKEQETLEAIQSARSNVRKEIKELKDKLKIAQENVQIIKDKVEAEELFIEDN